MDAKISSLMAVVNTPGYVVLLDYFKDKVNELEREVFNVDPADVARIVAAQRIAVAARWLLETTQKQIQHDISLATAGDPAPMSEKELQELYIKSLQ